MCVYLYTYLLYMFNMCIYTCIHVHRILFIVHNLFWKNAQLLYFRTSVHFFSSFHCDLSVMMWPIAYCSQEFDHQYYSSVTNEPGMCSAALDIQYYDKQLCALKEKETFQSNIDGRTLTLPDSTDKQRLLFSSDEKANFKMELRSWHTHLSQAHCTSMIEP